MSDKVIGICEIRNGAAERSYIGSSIDAWARMNHHRKLLRECRHWNKWLQADWSSYGEAVFEFAVIEEAPEADLVVVEQR